MQNDPIVAEVRRARATHAAQFNNDLERIYRAIKEEERKSGRKFRTYPPRGVQHRRETHLTLKEPREKYGDESGE